VAGDESTRPENAGAPAPGTAGLPPTTAPEPAGAGLAADPAADPAAEPAAVPATDPAAGPAGDDAARSAAAAGATRFRDPNAPHRFGEVGRPFHRNPFLVGFLGGLGLLLAYGVFIGLRNAASILVLIFVALFLAVGLNPAVTRLRRWGMPRGFAVLTVAFGILLLFCGGLFALIPPLITQSTELVNNAPEFIRDLQRNRTINELFERYGILERVQGALNANTVTNALGGVLGGARLLFGTIFNVLTVLVLTIYFMAAFDRIKNAGYRLVPASRRDRVELLGDEILAKVGAYMVGALAIAVVAGISTWAFAMIVGLAYPFALAVVVAICDLIPQIGATLGAVIVSIVGFATSLTAGIACVVFFVIYQQLENYFIYPKVMKRSVEVSDVASIVAALVGVGLFGVLGALIAIPTIAAVQLILREVVNPSMDRR
jgi:predicted PurR-regulated permease PerM